MQNGHTRKTAYTFYCILQLIYKENQTEPTVSEIQTKTETEPEVFLKTEPNLKDPFRTSLTDINQLSSHQNVVGFNVSM